MVDAVREEDGVKEEWRGLNEMAREIGRIGAWAPGNYICKCSACDRTFEGDKRAMNCLPCAIQALQAAYERQVQLREQFQEDVESLHQMLDIAQVPREGPLGPLSIVGRVLSLAKGGVSSERSG